MKCLALFQLRIEGVLNGNSLRHGFIVLIALSEHRGPFDFLFFFIRLALIAKLANIATQQYKYVG